MKINWNTKYTTIAVYTFLVICCVILFYLGVSQIGNVMNKLSSLMSIMQPIIIGCVLAYIFNFILKFYETKLLKDEYLKKIKIKSPQAH